MQMAQFLEALEADVDRIAAVGDEAIAQAASRVTQAIRGSAGLRLLDVLGEAALELSAQLPSGHVEVRLAGGDPQLVVAEQVEEPAGPAPGDDALTARITLRLPEGLKASVELAASREGMSVNSWLLQAISRSVDRRGQTTRAGRRISGWARS